MAKTISSTRADESRVGTGTGTIPITKGERSDISYRPAILRLLLLADSALSVFDIESAVGEYVRGLVTGSVEWDIASLLQDEMVGRSIDGRYLSLTDLGAEAARMLS